MTWFCIEYLNRLPEEIDLPLSLITRAQMAAQVAGEKRNAELEAQSAKLKASSRR